MQAEYGPKMLEGQMKVKECEEMEKAEEEQLDSCRGGNDLEDITSLTCFHLLPLNWVKLARTRGTKEKYIYIYLSIKYLQSPGQL